MRRYILSLAVLALLFGPVGQANAVLMSDNSDVIIGDLGTARYPDFSNLELETTIAFKTFPNLDPITTTITYASIAAAPEDLDFSSGFRLVELIENDTGVAWIDYHLTISDGDFLQQAPFASGDAGLPNLANLSDATGPGADFILDLLPPGPGDSAPVISGNTVWFDFTNNPILDGDILQIFVGIASLDPTGGSLTLTQHPSASPIPEPGTLLLIGSGLVGIGVGARRRRRK